MPKLPAAKFLLSLVPAICITAAGVDAQSEQNSYNGEKSAPAQAPASAQGNSSTKDLKSDYSLSNFFQLNTSPSSDASAGAKKSTESKRSTHGMLWHVLDNFGIPMFFSGNGPLLDPSLNTEDPGSLNQSSFAAASREAGDLRPALPLTPTAVLKKENRIPEAELEGSLFETGTKSDDKANSR